MYKTCYILVPMAAVYLCHVVEKCHSYNNMQLNTFNDHFFQAAFRHIDYDYVVKCAEIAKESGVKQLSIVTSSGASASSFFLYLKTKGEVRVNLFKKSTKVDIRVLWKTAYEWMNIFIYPQ